MTYTYALLGILFVISSDLFATDHQIINDETQYVMSLNTSQEYAAFAESHPIATVGSEWQLDKLLELAFEYKGNPGAIATIFSHQLWDRITITAAIDPADETKGFEPKPMGLEKFLDSFVNEQNAESVFIAAKHMLTKTYPFARPALEREVFGSEPSILGKNILDFLKTKELTPQDPSFNYYLSYATYMFADQSQNPSREFSKAKVLYMGWTLEKLSYKQKVSAQQFFLDSICALMKTKYMVPYHELLAKEHIIDLYNELSKLNQNNAPLTANDNPEQKSTPPPARSMRDALQDFLYEFPALYGGFGIEDGERE